MNILILRSSFQSDNFVRTEYAELLDLLKNRCEAEIEIIGDENMMVETQNFVSLQGIDYIMVATGGVENLFKTIFSVETMCTSSLQKTITLIADGRNNSLAASLEILSYLSENGHEGRIIHGTNYEIINDIVETFHETSLLQTKAHIEEWLAANVWPRYRGPLGVDLMVDARGQTFVSEINFRHTKGMVAHEKINQQ